MTYSCARIKPRLPKAPPRLLAGSMDMSRRFWEFPRSRVYKICEAHITELAEIQNVEFFEDQLCGVPCRPTQANLY